MHFKFEFQIRDGHPDPLDFLESPTLWILYEALKNLSEGFSWMHSSGPRPAHYQYAKAARENDSTVLMHFGKLMAQSDQNSVFHSGQSLSEGRGSSEVAVNKRLQA